VSRAGASERPFEPGLVAWAVLITGCGDPGGTQADRPPDGAARAPARNAVLVVADTLRADRLGCYGYGRDTSPAIDRLAAEGVLFEHCYAQACWTVPSMISLMAGVPVTKEEKGLPGLPVLAETLQSHGLTTVGFVANAAVGLDRGFERGFDRFVPCFEDRAAEVVAAFEAWYRPWLAEAGAPADGRRFFAWIHWVDPHFPYEPEPEHALFDGPREGFEDLKAAWEEAEPRVQELAPGRPGLPTAQAVQQMNAASNRYDGEVRAVDAALAALVALLEETGQREETLIVFCADHGELLYEQENFPYLVRDVQESNGGGLPGGVMDLFGAGHRPWYFEQVWHTPLVFSGPGMPRGERRGGLAANLDIYPTVLAALGLPRPPHLAGESLLGGREPARQQVFAYGHHTTAVLDRRGEKLVVHWPRSYLLPNDAEPPLELFDLGSDPGEQENLAEREPATAERLRASIAAWRSAHDRAVIDTQSAEDLRRLHELGYAGDDPAGGGEDGD
jgi:arylsulfatase A-like enzyme